MDDQCHSSAIRTGVCVAATRVYVQKGIADKFIEKYVENMEAAADDLGDPQEPSVKMGLTQIHR